MGLLCFAVRALVLIIVLILVAEDRFDPEILQPGVSSGEQSTSLMTDHLMHSRGATASGCPAAVERSTMEPEAW